MSYPRPPLEQRFWAKVSPCPNTGCWWWMGSAPGRTGYGTLMLNYVAIPATHISLGLHGCLQPSDKAIACHHCDQRLCVNPDHLYWGTDATNALDAYGRGRRVTPPAFLALAAAKRSQTHCKHGHEFTPENTKSQPGGRTCRECARIAQRAFVLRRKNAHRAL